jgi:hypothetical protein
VKASDIVLYQRVWIVDHPLILTKFWFASGKVVQIRRREALVLLDKKIFGQALIRMRFSLLTDRNPSLKATEAVETDRVSTTWPREVFQTHAQQPGFRHLP